MYFNIQFLLWHFRSLFLFLKLCLGLTHILSGSKRWKVQPINTRMTVGWLPQAFTIIEYILNKNKCLSHDIAIYDYDLYNSILPSFLPSLYFNLLLFLSWSDIVVIDRYDSLANVFYHLHKPIQYTILCVLHFCQ